MNALFANLIWATPDLFRSESFFELRVEKLFAERVSEIDLLTDEVQLAPAYEQEIAAVTSRRSDSVFAEERFVEPMSVDVPAPVANDFAPEFDVIGQNRAFLDNDFEAFLAEIAPDEDVPLVDLDIKLDGTFDGIEPCVIAEEETETGRLIDDTEIVSVEVNWNNIDGLTGFATASIDDIG